MTLRVGEILKISVLQYIIYLVYNFKTSLEIIQLVQGVLQTKPTIGYLRYFGFMACLGKTVADQFLRSKVQG